MAVNGSANSRITVFEDISGPHKTTRFRYNRDGFRQTLIIAAGLTALVCGLTWMILGIWGSRYMNAITVMTGSIFFIFLSARALMRYLRDEVVMAVQPTGLYDARMAPDTVPWPAIKELVLTRREKEFALIVKPWPNAHELSRETELDLSALDEGPEAVLAAIAPYMMVREDL